MNNQDKKFATVIIEYGIRSTEIRSPKKTHFCRGEIDGYSGHAIVVKMPGGSLHEFSRDDGRWLSGDCTNYVDGAIVDFPAVENAIQCGFGGDVAAYVKSIPQVAQEVSQ